MRRFLAPSALALALVLAGCGDDDDAAESGGGATTAPAPVDETTTAPTTAGESVTTQPDAESGAATINVGETDLGPVLVDADGFTLYLFTNDAGGTSSCAGGCADTWPPVISDAPSGGDGVNGGLLDTTARDDGSSQVTYNGHPLYRYAPDAAAGDTTGHGVGGVWFAVDADGNAVE